MTDSSNTVVTDTVAANKVVTIHYTLKDDEGVVIDTSSGREPLPYLQGFGNIVPGLERAMNGHAVGDRFDVTVPAEDAYGVHDGQPPQATPREHFPDDIEIFPGMQFAAQTPDGEVIPLWVTEVSEDTIHVDANHPLAGQTLHFSIEVVSTRDATAEELEHGHPHGPDGHAHH